MIKIFSFGDKQAPQMVIFCHGFAVKHDSLGTFSAIADKLAQEGFLAHLFNLSDYDDLKNTKHVYPLSFNKQLERLKLVISQLKPKELNLVGHSLGSLLAATYCRNQGLASDRLRKLVLLAPPARDEIGLEMKNRFENDDRVRLEVESGNYILTSKKGIQSHFRPDYFKELGGRSREVYYNLLKSESKKILTVWSSQDIAHRPIPSWWPEEVLSKKIDSDHNFSDQLPYLSQMVADFLK